MRGGLCDVLGLRRTANGAGISLHARFLAGRGLRDNARVPRMVFFFHMVCVIRAYTLMLRVVQLCPRAPAVIDRIDRFGLRRTAHGTGVRLHARSGTGRGLRNNARVPRMVFFFHMVCVIRAYTLMLRVVQLCPRAVVMAGRVDGLRLGGGANRTGVGLHARRRAGRGLGHNACVPCMVRFLHVRSVVAANSAVLRVV